MKNKPTKKKETVLSVLKDIRALLQRNQPVDAINVKTPEVSTNQVVVEFPQKTAKEMIEECNNKIESGKVIYSYPHGWYKNEAFYTTEKPRIGKHTIVFELLHKGNSWNECQYLLKQGESMLNFAEAVYLLINYPQFRKMLVGWNYTWTCSRSADGYLVLIGRCDAGGVRVDGWGPGGSDSSLGVCFSRSLPS